MSSRGGDSKIEDLSKDPVYEKLEALDPYKYFENSTSGRNWARHTNEMKKILLIKFESEMNNPYNQGKYEKYLNAEKGWLIELILSPKYIPEFDYRFFNDSAFTRKVP